MKKKLLSLLLAVLIFCTLLPAAGAANVSADEAIDALMTLGLTKGTGTGFSSDAPLTRAQAAVMMVRLLGCEGLAEAAALPSGFPDVPAWAEADIGWAHEQGLLMGFSETRFGADEPARVRDYLTFVLRALGYIEGEDFHWTEAVAFADKLGLTHGEYTGDVKLLREDMALISYTALTLRQKNSTQTLIERLYLDGIVSYSALRNTRLAGYANTEKQVLTARELYERASSSVFYLEVFATEADEQKDLASGTGSGFFISADGLALLTYHELDGSAYAVATTTDGRQYELTRVLYYDPLRDLALVRIATTDREGRSVRFFPYLELGDSNAVSNGDTVYTVSSPIGLQDSISAGMISNRSRIVDDPAYPCLQFTAPISQGSSGGVLLNEYGEAIGIIFGTFVSGQSLNLAVPINAAEGLSRSASGRTLAEVCEIENAKKAAATLSAMPTHLTLYVGESATVMVRHTAPGTVSIMYHVQVPEVLGCAWGSFETKQTVPLTITALAEGESTVEITFAEEGLNPEAKAVIEVEVLTPPQQLTTP